MSQATRLENLTTEPVTQMNWGALESLFEDRGGPHPCWCSVWRKPGTPKKPSSKQEKKASLKALVDQGQAVGLLAFQADVPVAWCSLAPRSAFTPGFAPQSDDSIGECWAISCFFVRLSHRGQGLKAYLIQSAEAVAKAAGAKLLIATPVPKDSTSYRFTGFVPTFESAGFKVQGPAGTRRTVMSKPLD